MCKCLYVCMCECRCLQSSEEGIRTPGTGVTGGCEPPDVDTKN